MLTDVDLTTIYSYRTDAWGTTSNLLGGDQTQLMRKTTWEGDVPVNFAVGTFDPSGHSLSGKTQYAYNLQGRMSETVTDEDQDGDPDIKMEYEYGDDGIRVVQTEIEDTNDDNVFSETPVDTIYIYDGNNPTGYAQILEEKDGTTGAVTKTYTLGHDVIAQQAPSVESGDTLFLLYDGHGSTRGLVDPTGQPLSNQIYRYDAFGNRLDTNDAITSILFSGEQTDATGLQYLRARYYDPAVGRFNRLDPFAGDSQDPQSLHKYLYCSANPIMGIDPTGEFFFLTLSGSYLAATLANIQAEVGNLTLQSLVSGDFAWDMFLYNAAIMGAPAVLGMAASFSGLWATIPRYRGAVELGELVGRGGDKLVYALRNSADEVLAVAKPTARALENIEKEIGTLATLRGMGFPTVGIKGVTTFQGQRAIVMEKFAIGSKDILGAGGTTRYLNQRSIQELKNIKRMMVEGRVWVNDLQFLFGRDGRVVIADALDAIAGRTPSDKSIKIINKLIRLAGGTP